MKDAGVGEQFENRLGKMAEELKSEQKSRKQAERQIKAKGLELAQTAGRLKIIEAQLRSTESRLADTLTAQQEDEARHRAKIIACTEAEDKLQATVAAQRRQLKARRSSTTQRGRPGKQA